MVIRRITRAPPLPSPAVEKDGMPDWTDRELLKALAEHDPRAGLMLYDRLIRVVEWTILRIMGQRSIEHEDLVQAAFEQIVVSIHRQRFAYRCTLSSWASAVSCHVALNALRTRRRQRAFQGERAPGDVEPANRTDLESQLVAREALARVRDELALMSAERAEALVLHDINGLELSEIARVLGISVMAAQSRLSRGRRELMERLNATGTQEEGS
jgi:RNA polymerase sigma-70 factor (ECF subfamily)